PDLFTNLLRWHTGQEVVEGRCFDRFDEVMVEACLFGALLVLLLSPAGQGDEGHVFSPGLFPDVPGRIEAVELRQADVEQYDVRPEGASEVDGFESVVGHADFMPR